MHQGRGGMGMTKHGKSGHATRSPRFKFMQGLEANRPVKKPKAKLTASSVQELFGRNK